MTRKAVFLDRDGTLNHDVGFPGSWDLIEVYPYSYDAVRRINQAGLLAVIVTNQSGIGRGLIEEAALIDIHCRLKRSFQKHGARLDGIYYCPHHPGAAEPAYGAPCSCRKPLPGMGKQATEDLDIETSESYMVGDKVEDIQFGLAIGAKPVLVQTGHGRRSLETLKELKIPPAHVADNLEEAVDWILDEELSPGKGGPSENSSEPGPCA